MQFKYARKIGWSDVISTPVTPRNVKEQRTSVMKPLKSGLVGGAVGGAFGVGLMAAVNGNPMDMAIAGGNLGVLGLAAGAVHGGYTANKKILQGRADRGEKLVTKKELRDFHNRPINYNVNW